MGKSAAMSIHFHRQNNTRLSVNKRQDNELSSSVIERTFDTKMGKETSMNVRRFLRRVRETFSR